MPPEFDNDRPGHLRQRRQVQLPLCPTRKKTMYHKQIRTSALVHVTVHLDRITFACLHLSGSVLYAFVSGVSRRTFASGFVLLLSPSMENDALDRVLLWDGNRLAHAPQVNAQEGVTL
jgi:hypothetical protein